MTNHVEVLSLLKETCDGQEVVHGAHVRDNLTGKKIDWCNLTGKKIDWCNLTGKKIDWCNLMVKIDRCNLKGKNRLV